MSEFFKLWWSDWPSFFQMGRHGLYVWSSVATVVLMLVFEQIALRQHARRLRNTKDRL